MTDSLAVLGVLAENPRMSDELKTKVRIQRPARVQSDGSGGSVGSESARNADLELLSTVALKSILKSSDTDAKKSIAEAAKSGDEGVLARDTATGHFEILDDTDLQKVIEQDRNPAKQQKVDDVSYEPAADKGQSIDELSLVSTLALRKILKDDDAEEAPPEEGDSKGYNPYGSV